MQQAKPFKVVYALIWKAHEPDETFIQQEFDNRMPRLMLWLKDLHAQGKLAGCGGGGFENRSGGLTLVYAENVEEAKQIGQRCPLNEIGSTEIFEWDVFYANLVDTQRALQISSN